MNVCKSVPSGSLKRRKWSKNVHDLPSSFLANCKVEGFYVVPFGHNLEKLLLCENNCGKLLAVPLRKGPSSSTSFYGIMCRSAMHHLDVIYLFLFFSDAKEAPLLLCIGIRPAIWWRKPSWWDGILRQLYISQQPCHASYFFKKESGAEIGGEIV